MKKTIEQEFAIALFNLRIEKMTLKEAQEALKKMYEQTLIGLSQLESRAEFLENQSDQLRGRTEFLESRAEFLENQLIALKARLNEAERKLNGY